MWFIIDTATGKTVAMTAFKDAAELIATNFPTICIIRYAKNIESGYTRDSMFFEKSQKIKKMA